MQTELEKLLNWKWYTQGVPSVPSFLVSVAGVPSMQEGLGYSYRTILGLYKEGYGEWNYPLAYLEKNGEIIIQKLKADPKYLEKTRAQYNRKLGEFDKVFQKVEKQLESFSKKELVELLQELWIANSYTVASSHLLESISLRFEKDIRHLLKSKKTDRLNEEFSILTTPTTPSFVSEKEELLWKIKTATNDQKKKLVETFIRQFYWSDSSYGGSNVWTTEKVIQEAKNLTEIRKTDFEKIKKQKEALFEKYHFSAYEKNLIYWSDFATAWQDDRKTKTLRGVYCLARLLERIGQQFGLDSNELGYFTADELTLTMLENKSEIEKMAQERKNGCASIDNEKGRVIFAVPNFEQARQKLHQNHLEMDTLSGTTASMGTATGPVKVCTTLESISKVQQGDILVASMTRPEYVPAMKKAAAVITDEGGVTCHAAIVSRELGIPCIIGIRNATRLLKDGWIVQVKANHGQIMVLEKK